MSRNKPINVKVSTAKVLNALKEALDSRKKILADAEKARQQYEKDKKDFLDQVGKLFREGKGKVVSVDPYHSYRLRDEEISPRFTIVAEMPKNLKMPVEPEQEHAHWSVKTEIEELENAIKILSLTDEEYVSTNTYNGVARYI